MQIQFLKTFTLQAKNILPSLARSISFSSTQSMLREPVPKVCQYNQYNTIQNALKTCYPTSDWQLSLIHI